ncbi:MAG TPA: enoyl-CoA hydratase-related protein [Saprospiraceae bacterium]|nr:enoyl-CoA hydratase-related protein [Saprospiraceae bacterium]
MSINRSLEQDICILTINRESSLNALNREVIQNLKEQIQEVKNNLNKYKGLIITGAGPKAFVAGADISEFVGLSEIQARSLAEDGLAVFDELEQLEIPTIAAVNGFALGGGCELAMACHLRMASSNARFGQPEVNLGLIPGYGGTQRLVRYIGRSKAIELLMTGDMIDAQDAYRLGLVNYVVEPDQLIPRCIELINKISAKAPLAIAQIVRCVNAYYEHSIGAFSIESDRFGHLMVSEDCKEGISAFLDKRKAQFKGQ